MNRTPLQDPEFLPFKLDVAQRRLLLLRLSGAQRADAAFLDDRALPTPPIGVWVPLRTAVEEGRQLPASPNAWIFHIGHCGSTLLSRLLQDWPGWQVLREPLPLRTLAAAMFERSLPPDELRDTLEALSRLWARPLVSGSATLVKATSSCNGLVELVLGQRPQDRAILLDMPLRSYLATLLKSPGSIQDAVAAAAERMTALQELLPQSIAAAPPRTPGEVCAMGWLAERARFDSIAANNGRALRVDFERLLAAPREVLEAVAVHLRLAPAHLDTVLESPWWRRYAKAGQHPYGIADRAHDQRLAQERFADEIERGITWVRGASPRHAD